MSIVRTKISLVVVGLVLLGLVGATVFWWIGRGATPAAPPLAAEKLRDATERRIVNRTDQLIWDYQERIRQNTADVNAYVVLGMAYLQRARETGDPTYYGRAEEVFDEALAREPQNVEALIGKGGLANVRHQFHEALALSEQARDLNPTIARVYGVIADAQIELGMYDTAVQTLQTMVDLRPDLSSYSRISYARELHGDTAGAIEVMEQAVMAGGPATENSLWVRVQLGNLHFNAGDLASAEQQYQGALAQSPDYVYALGGLARVRAAQAHYDEAIDLYNQAIARMPLPEFVIGLGETQEAAGRPAEAVKQYDLVRAMQQLFAANGVDTDLELALFDADHGRDPQAALALARAAYARRPNIKAADTLAWALFKAGQFAEARGYADQALHLGTRDALTLYHAGMIAQAQDDSAAARDYLQRALEVNPHFSPLYAPRAQQALAKLGAPAG
jgi:tetratricopeptide (TPR) repeat protein